MERAAFREDEMAYTSGPFDGIQKIVTTYTNSINNSHDLSHTYDMEMQVKPTYGVSGIETSMPLPCAATEVSAQNSFFLEPHCSNIYSSRDLLLSQTSCENGISQQMQLTSTPQQPFAVPLLANHQLPTAFNGSDRAPAMYQSIAAQSMSTITMSEAEQSQATPTSTASKPQHGQESQLTNVDRGSTLVSATEMSQNPSTNPTLLSGTGSLDMENLARVCCRMTMASNWKDMDTSLEEMLRWCMKCKDLALIQFALRDFQQLIYAKRQLFAGMWTMEFDKKCEHAMGRLTHVIIEHNKFKKNTGIATLSTAPVHEAKQNDYAVMKSDMIYKGHNQEKRPICATSLATVANAVDENNLNKKHKTAADTPSSNMPGKLCNIIADTTTKANEMIKCSDPPKSDATNGFLYPRLTTSNSFPAIAPPCVVPSMFDVLLNTRGEYRTAEIDDRLYFPPKTISKVMLKLFPDPSIHLTDKDSSAATTLNLKSIGKKVADKAKQPSTMCNSATLDLSLPSLPHSSRVQIDAEAISLMQECATEFILYMTSEAADHAVMKKKRANIAGPDVICALDNLGFDKYGKVLQVLDSKFKQLQDNIVQKKQERRMQERCESATNKPEITRRASEISNPFDQIAQARQNIWRRAISISSASVRQIPGAQAAHPSDLIQLQPHVPQIFTCAQEDQGSGHVNPSDKT